VQVARARNAPHLEGQRLGEIARAQDRDPFEVYFDLLVEHEGNVGGVFFSMCEDDVQTVMRWPQTMVGSDASSVAPYGQLGEGKPHPRAYGTFPRVLGRYVRELGTLRWEEAVHKMTAAPAQRLGLGDRGELRPGAFADVVVLDPATVADRATFQNPHQYAAGIEHVIVNGSAVVRDGEHTGALPGRVLRKS
jgi:N-acyl-D-amino-acid deacylase